MNFRAFWTLPLVGFAVAPALAAPLSAATAPAVEGQAASSRTAAAATGDTAGLGYVYSDTPRPRTHGGFYLGLQSGPAYFSASSDWDASPGVPAGSREFAGPSVALWLSIGGVVANRVALAAIVSYEPVVSLSATDESGNELDVEDVSFTLRGQGALVDYYLSPRGGFHILGALGFAQLGVSRADFDRDDPVGTFWALGAGYDWWASDGASVGILGRVSSASLKSEEGSARADLSAFSFGLHLTATLNGGR
jgi:hypothetical protein